MDKYPICVDICVCTHTRNGLFSEILWSGIQVNFKDTTKTWDKSRDFEIFASKD